MELEEATDTPLVEEKAEPIEANVVSPLITNISLMAATLGNRQTITLPKSYLKDKGAVYEAYDKQHQYLDTQLQVLTYGPYAMAWGYENFIILTHKTLIPWIQ
jgi:hypothetical protein